MSRATPPAKRSDSAREIEPTPRTRGRLRGRSVVLNTSKNTARGSSHQLSNLAAAKLEDGGASPAPVLRWGLRVVGRVAVLVVDSEPFVSDTVCRTLTRYGYQTLAAATPRDALQFVACGPALDLLVTEIVLSEMSGPELARAVFEKSDPHRRSCSCRHFPRPEMPPEIPFIQKPFTAQVLVSRVEAALQDAAKARDQLRTTLGQGWQLIADARTLLAESAASHREAAGMRRRSQELRERWLKDRNR